MGQKMKKISKIGKAFKNLILNTYHLPPKKIFKKIKLLILFQKKGLRGSKKVKKIFKIKKGFKNLILNTYHLPFLKDFQKK